MIKELLLLAAIGTGGAYAVDSQFRTTVNDAIATAIGAPSTTTSAQNNPNTSAQNNPNTSAQNNNQGSGIGWAQLQQYFAQLFSNQQQLQSEINATGTTPPPVSINYPSNNSGSGSTGVSAYLAYLLEQQQAAAAAAANGSSTTSSSSSSSGSSTSSGSGGSYIPPATSSGLINPLNGQTIDAPTGSYITGSTLYTTGNMSPLSASGLNVLPASSSASTSTPTTTSSFNPAAALAAGYTVVPDTSAAGGYILKSGAQTLNIYGNPIT